MQFSPPETYTVTRTNTPYVVTEPFGTWAQTDRPKIYVFHRGREFIYVGETIQSVKGRLQLASQRKPGRGGYLWGENGATAQLTVWTDIRTADRDKTVVKKVEGELATLVRVRTGSWPATQKGLWVGNFGPDVADEAERMFAHITRQPIDV